MTRRDVARVAVMRTALSLPVVSLILYALLTEGVPRPGLAAVVLAVGAALVVVTLGMLSRDAMPSWWVVGATVVGVSLLPPLIVWGLAAPADTSSLLFVLVLVLGAFAFPARRRTFLLAFTLVAWFVTLWWGGVVAYDLLLLHLGAGALVAYTMVRTADALSRATAGQAASRQDAERRADLLARTLEVHTLDREEVLSAVLDGLEDVGFASASVRVVSGDRLVLAAGRSLHGQLEESIRIDEQLPGLAARTGRIERVHDPERLRELQVEPGTFEAIAVPIGTGGPVEAVVTAITLDGPTRPQQREAIELLAALAARALRRAEAYDADERTVAELQRLEARTQDFVSTVSHELRTPLTVVQGLGRTLRTRWDDLEPERRDDLLRRVESNAGRLGEMVRSLLDTSALEEGRMALRLEAVSVRDLVDVLLHRLASVTAAHPVRTTVPDDVCVLADRPLLAHVLENLLTNITKHTPQGTHIHITAEVRDDDRVAIAVRDDGPGIPAEDLPHVLDRFYRGGDPVARPAGGLGLGLALANEIVVAHGSAMSIVSEEGQGATFAFTLSAVPCHDATSAGPSGR